MGGTRNPAGHGPHPARALGLRGPGPGASVPLGKSAGNADATGFPATGVQTINSIAPLAGNFSINAGSNITITPGANSISIASTGGSSFPWTSITLPQTLAVNNGYIVTSSSLDLLLPATSAVGAVIKVILKGGTSWRLTQAAGQSITVNNLVSTVGTGGSVATTGSGQTIEIVCTTANLAWVAQSAMGNFLVT